jgi:exonuclease III
VQCGGTWELFTSLERVEKGSRARARVSILIHRKWKSKIRNWRFMGERILLMELVTYGREVVVIGAYAPTNDTASVGKDKFWDTLQRILKEIPRRKEIIIMGDMNARVGCGNKSKAMGTFGD